MISRCIFALSCFLFLPVLKSQAIPFNWLDRIGLAKEMLRKVELAHSPKIITYREVIKIPLLKKTKKGKHWLNGTITRTHHDYARKEAALAVMSLDNGSIEIVKIIKEGRGLRNINSKFEISVEERRSGLAWNGKNTAFRVICPSGYVVIADKWIRGPLRSRGRIIRPVPEEVIFTPYSEGIHQPELIKAGKNELDKNIELAIYRLGGLGVGSLAQPDKNIANSVKPEFLKNIALAEHTDPQEFYSFKYGLFKYNPFERVEILLAANGDETFSTFNYAGAIGLMQFTNNSSKRRKSAGTWDMVRGAYPSAQLRPFEIGAINPRESIAAAILLRDYNANELVKSFGQVILEDENLDFYLYAAHNCGIGRVIKALKKSRKNWCSVLHKLSRTDETIIYLEKIEYLLKND